MDTESIINRMLVITGAENEGQLAIIIGMKPGNFSARKKKGTLWEVITEWAVNEDVDLNWLLKGKLTTEKQLSNPYLLDIEEWLNVRFSNDPRRLMWFEIEFEKNFEEFREWKKRKEREENILPESGTSKVA